MRRRFLAVLAVGWALGVIGLPALAKEPLGSPSNPHKNKGPLGAWVSNGNLGGRVTRVQEVTDLESYTALPWSDRLTADLSRKNFDFVERRVFRQGKKVVLVTLEIKNLNAKKIKLGLDRPSWVLRCEDQRQGRFSGHHEVVATEGIQGGMPRGTLLNPGGSVTGIMVIFIPDNASPRLLTFTSGRHSDYGDTETLVWMLTPKR